MHISGEDVLFDVFSHLARQTSFPRLRTLLLHCNDEECNQRFLRNQLAGLINARARCRETPIPDHPYPYIDYLEPTYLNGKKRGVGTQLTKNWAPRLHHFEILLPRFKPEELRAIFEHTDFWTLCGKGPESSYMKKTAKAIDDDLKFMEALIGKGSMTQAVGYISFRPYKNWIIDIES